jgi:hypothetical protein
MKKAGTLTSSSPLLSKDLAWDEAISIPRGKKAEWKECMIVAVQEKYGQKKGRREGNVVSF